MLIQGASSGVGLMGLQIAKLKGARLVMGTSTNAKRRERLKEFGADLAVDTTQKDWADEVLEATDGKGVDLIVDQVSASVANENLRAAAVLGRIVNVGRLGGFKGEFDFDLHAMKRIDYIGVTFRTRSVEEVREIVRVMRADLWGDVESGKLRLPIDQHLPARSGRGRAGAHARQRALRQDRADGLMPHDYDGHRPRELHAMSATRQGPLSRFKVIDLTRARAGPTAARQFADWGADVIKVEMPQDGDEDPMMGGSRRARTSSTCTATSAASRSTSRRRRRGHPEEDGGRAPTC